MGEVSTVGLDLAKHVFQVHGVDEQDNVVMRKPLRRSAVLSSSQSFRPARSGSRPVQPRITGRGNSRRWGTL